MKFISYSLTFKVFAVGLVLSSIYEFGAHSEGKTTPFPIVVMMWFLHCVAIFGNMFLSGSVEGFSYGLLNFVMFFGSLLCLILVSKFIKSASVQNPSPKRVAAIISMAVFLILNVLRYVDIFVNQQRSYVDRGKVFWTPESMIAFNAYDNIIAIAVLIQIAQALINSVLKRSLKR